MYCPVASAHDQNATRDALHQDEPTLRKRWREANHRPGQGTRKGEVRTRVLALLDEHTPKRWILYGDESQGPGSGIEAAVRFAERSGLRSLAIGPGTDPSLGEREARQAMERASANPVTRLIVHSGPVTRWPERGAATE